MEDAGWLGEERAGDAALRGALRRWRRAPAPPSPPNSGGEETGSDANVEARVATSFARPRWWPRLTAPQVQAILGAGITLALLLWEQLRQRLGQ